MIGNLHQRIGDADVKAGSAASTGSERRAWGSVITADIVIRQQGAVHVDRFDGSVRVSGFPSGLANLAVGSNDLRSQCLGAYGSRISDPGFYADAVLQAGRHRYTVEPLLNQRSGGKGDSLTATIEVGRAFAMDEGGGKIEPPLQLIHQHLSLDNIAITGAKVRQDSGDGWIARVGVRMKGAIARSLGTLQPYGRFNIYKSSGGADVARLVGPAVTTDIRSLTGFIVSELADVRVPRAAVSATYTKGRLS